MYSFEGDFKRKPQQDLSGASSQRKTDRNSLLLQLQQQRQKREEHRKRLNSTIKIQAYVRSYLIRKHCKQNERDQFDNDFPKLNEEDHVMATLLIAKLLFFYNIKKDISRLISISQLLLKQCKTVFHNMDYYIQMRRLLALHLQLLKGDLEVALDVPLRMFEVFTALNKDEICRTCEGGKLHFVKNTFLYLVKRGYYKEIHKLMCENAQLLYDGSPDTPTPLCNTLLDLIQRPLYLIERLNEELYEDIVMTEFVSAFLCDPYAEPVSTYVIPTLRQGFDNHFPFLGLIHCLTDDSKFSTKRLANNSWLLHSLLALEPPRFVNEIRATDDTRLPNSSLILIYLKVIAKLTPNMCNKQINYEFEDCLYCQETAEDQDGDSDSETEMNITSLREQFILTRCIEMLNDQSGCVMTTVSQIGEYELCDEFLDYMSQICHHMLLSHRMALHKYRLLYTLAFKPMFIRDLWYWLGNLSNGSAFGGSSTLLIVALCRGLGVDGVMDVHRLLAPLDVFCALFSLFIGTLHDTEFMSDGELADPPPSMSTSATGRLHPFGLVELGLLCQALRQVCIVLVEFAYPESRPSFSWQYPAAVGTSGERSENSSRTPAWSHLFKVSTHLLRALYVRDTRLQFTGINSWSTEGVISIGLSPALVFSGMNTRANSRSQRGPSHIPAAMNQEEGAPIPIKELRAITILKEMPFIVPFSTRIMLFQALITSEKHDHWYDLSHFNEGPSINISVRRTHLYEDAFDKLSPENEPDLKLKLRVQLINEAGVVEAGVDGGGLFREFLSELLKSAFDPNRGLFRMTKDNMLYPNPGVHLLYDDFPRHYYFVGRMLGKAMYENLLVELPLAEFFLGKMCSAREADVHALASLDPALYRGLLQLKGTAREDLPDLGLDFTLLSDELGEQRIEELKPGGANIQVTADNRIEYIHLVADYKLNKYVTIQIRLQHNAFRRGVTSVINAYWLRMFSSRELQLLISGAEVPIDVEDLRKNTKYTGVYSDTHPTVQIFWKVVGNFTNDERRQLLKFVTSCSRPPLLGFKDLHPSFCIQSAGGSDRLPSSSTCMNLLKLPEFNSEEAMAERLLYAIQAGAGFELS